MKTKERNYVFETESIICDLERTDKFIQVLFEELDDAHAATLNADMHSAAYWITARKDVMQAILYATQESVSKVRTALQKWLDDSFESGE